MSSDCFRQLVLLSEAAILKPVDRMVCWDMTNKPGIGPAEASAMMNAEQRRQAPVRSDRQQGVEIGPVLYDRRPALGPAPARSAPRTGADRDLDIEAGADAADQPRRQQRVAAELEEVVVDADPLQPQHLGEQAAQDLLLRRARGTRRSLAASRPAPAAPRRSSLPFGVSGSAIQHHERRRHHVVGQAAAPDARAAPTASAALTGRRHHIGHQPLVAGRILARDHRRLRHLGMPQPAPPRSRPARCGTRASSPAASARPRNSSTPSRTPARQVPGPVHPAPRRAERVGHEPLRRQPRAPQIAARQARARNVKLARHAGRHRLQPAVQHIDPRVRDRTADRDVRASTAQPRAPHSRAHRSSLRSDRRD